MSLNVDEYIGMIEGGVSDKILDATLKNNHRQWSTEALSNVFEPLMLAGKEKSFYSAARAEEGKI